MIKQFIFELVSSLHNKPSGLSFRKLVSILMLILVVYLHIRWIDNTNVLDAILYDLTFICALLGLINLDKIIDLKWGDKKLVEQSKDDEAKQ